MASDTRPRPRRALALRIAWGILAAGLTTTTLAFGDPTAADKDTARGLMAEGRTHRDKGELPAALKAFAAADALMHVPTTGLEVAKAQVALNQLVEARDTALRVSRSAERPDDPAPFKAARDAATSLANDLQARIPSLTISAPGLSDGAGATLTIDGAEVPVEVLGHPRKLDPGHHVIALKIGGASKEAEVDVAEKDSKSVSIDVPSGEVPAATAEATPAPASTEASGGGSKIFVLGGFGLGAAGVLAGSITGVIALTKASSIKGSSACQNGGTVCNPSEDGDISSARSMATVSDVAFVTAGVGAVVGVIALLTSGGGSATPAPDSAPTSAPAAPTESARIVPWIGFGAAGLSGRF